MSVTVTVELNGVRVPLVLDDEALAVIAEQIPTTSESPASLWLYGAAAAGAYLGWSPQKVYKALARLPHYRVGQRLAFRRDELDSWVDEHREGRGR